MAAVAASLAASAAMAQAPAAAPPALDTWVKICVQDKAKKNTLCRTGYDILSADGRVLVQAILTESTVQKQRTITFSFPTGVQITPGIEAKVDGALAAKGVYGYCTVSSCLAQAPVSEEFLAAMKRGTALSVNLVDNNEKPLAYTVPLATFKAVHEGPSLDGAAIRAREEAIARLGQESKRSTFDQLLEAQRKAREGN